MQGRDAIIRKRSRVIRIVAIDDEFVAVKTIQSVLRAKPQKAFVILQNGADQILRKPELAGEAVELNARRGVNALGI